MELLDILTYDYSEVSDVEVTAIETGWQDLLQLITPSRVAGIYELAIYLQFYINSTSKDLLYQFSLDGGVTWGPIYEKRVKGRGNIENLEVFNILDRATEGVIDIRCRVSKSDDVSCNVLKAFITCERKA